MIGEIRKHPEELPNADPLEIANAECRIKVRASSPRLLRGKVFFRLCANSDPQHDSIFIPQSGIRPTCSTTPPVPLSGTSGGKLGIDATKKLPGECLKRPWPSLIKMDAAVRAKVNQILKSSG